MDEGVIQYYVRIKMDGEIDYLLKADQQTENKTFQQRNCGMIITTWMFKCSNDNTQIITSNHPLIGDSVKAPRYQHDVIVGYRDTLLARQIILESSIAPLTGICLRNSSWIEPHPPADTVVEGE
jgi:hypothetical protein